MKIVSHLHYMHSLHMNHLIYFTSCIDTANLSMILFIDTGVCVVTAMFHLHPSIPHYPPCYHLSNQRLHTQKSAVTPLQHPLRTQLVRRSGRTRSQYRTSILTCWCAMTFRGFHPRSCYRRLWWWMVWEVNVTARRVVVLLGIGMEQRMLSRCGTVFLYLAIQLTSNCL